MSNPLVATLPNILVSSCSNRSVIEFYTYLKKKCPDLITEFSLLHVSLLHITNIQIIHIIRPSPCLGYPSRSIYVTNDHVYVPFVVIMIYYQVCSKSYTTSVTNGAGTAYPSTTPELTHGYFVGFMLLNL